MADPERPTKLLPASAFYGDILAARQNHETVEQMWGRIRDTLAGWQEQYANYTVRYAPDVFQAVNQLSANAAGVRGAQEQLNTAPASDSLTASVIGRPFYGRSDAEFQALAAWEGKIELIMDRAGAQVSQWITVQYDAGSLPDTIGDLRDDLEGFASSWATRYEGTLVGTGQLILNQI